MVASTTSQGTRDPRSRPATARSSGRSRTTPACTTTTSTFPRPATWDVEFTTRPGRPTETIPLTFDVRAVRSRPGRRAGARRRRPRRSPTSAATCEDLHRRQAGPGLLQGLGRPGPRRPRAVRAGLRDAGVLRERRVRSDARHDQAGRGRPPGRSRSSTSSRTSSRTDGQLQPVLDANGQLQTTPGDRRLGLLERAVDLRGRRQRASSAARSR